MKNHLVSATVLVFVAATFFLLGRYSRPEHADRAGRGEPVVRQDERAVAKRAARDATTVPVERPASAPAAEGGEQSLADALVAVLERVPRGSVAYATRQQYIDDDPDLKWHRLSEKLPDELPTGFRLGGARALDVLPLLAELTDVYYLRFHDCALTDEHVAGLAHLHRLVFLGLTKTGITDAALVHLRHLTDLRALNLSDTAVTDLGLRAVARLTSLRSLTIYDTAITDEGLAYLKALPDLESLQFRGLHLTEKALTYVTQLPKLQGLRLVDPVSEASLRRIAAMPSLKTLQLHKFESLKGLGGARSLEQLDLTDSRATNDDVKHLRGLASLKVLDLEKSLVDAEGLRHIAELGSLEELSLDETVLDHDALAEISTMTHLKTLNLDETSLDDDGVKRLAGLTGLEVLRLDDNAITDAVVDTLAGLENLTVLDLRATRLTPEGVARLRKALPGCEIKYP